MQTLCELFKREDLSTQSKCSMFLRKLARARGEDIILKEFLKKAREMQSQKIGWSKAEVDQIFGALKRDTENFSAKAFHAVPPHLLEINRKVNCDNDPSPVFVPVPTRGSIGDRTQVEPSLYLVQLNP
jgi:hypothetical protein